MSTTFNKINQLSKINSRIIKLLNVKGKLLTIGSNSLISGQSINKAKRISGIVEMLNKHIESLEDEANSIKEEMNLK